MTVFYNKLLFSSLQTTLPFIYKHQNKSSMVNVSIHHGAFTPALPHVNAPVSNITVFTLKLCIWLSPFENLQCHNHWETHLSAKSGLS